MARRRRQAVRQGPKRERHAFRGHATFWLATLSTVVGIATGMFTLRDELFPQEAGTAVAVSVPEYQQRVGRLCEQRNDDERRRAARDGVLRRTLKRARTTLEQRNALLDALQPTIAESGHALGSFAGLDTPRALAGIQRDTATAWGRTLRLLRGYARRLNRVAARSDLLAAVDHLSDVRPRLAEDGVRVTAGLTRLGGSECDLQPPIVTRTITLPNAKRERVGGSVSSPPDSAPTPGAGDTTGESGGGSLANVGGGSAGGGGSGDVSTPAPGLAGEDDPGGGTASSESGAAGGEPGTATVEAGNDGAGSEDGDAVNGERDSSAGTATTPGPNSPSGDG